VSADPSYDDVSGVWTVGNLAGGASAELMITATVLGSGSYLNEAEVTAADQEDFDSTPGNAATQQEDDNDSADLTPNAVVDLSLSKTVNNPGQDVGQDVTFTLTLSNAGDFSDATGVEVIDLLPAVFTS